VLRSLSLCTCCRHYPGAAAGRITSLIHPSRISLPRKGHRVGLRIVLFEAYSAFTRITACTLARSPSRDPLSEGFGYFVTSIAAPVASGWSDRRVGLAPTGKRRLSTAHTRTGPKTLAYEVTIEDPTVWTRPWTLKEEFTQQSDEENRIYTEPRCVEGNYGLPGLLHGRRVEDAAFAQGRGPDPATTDNTANFANTEVLEDPLQQ
jgi:hypothetical protein